MIKHPKYPRGNIYLSGGMEHAKNAGAGWRETAGAVLKRLGYFPLDITELDTHYTLNHGELYHGFGTDEEGLLKRKANIRKHFIFTDLQLIKNDSDAIIVYYDESVRLGAGTISECQYAFLHDIPIFLVSGYEDWTKEVPGWLFALSTKVFSTFHELFDYMEELPNGILKRDVYGNHRSSKQYLCSLSGKPFTKENHHFVSKVTPLYSKDVLKLVQEVNEDKKDRYEFFIEHLERESQKEADEIDTVSTIMEKTF